MLLSHRRCIEIMNAYGKERKAFDSPINSFGQVCHSYNTKAFHGMGFAEDAPRVVYASGMV